MKWLVDNISFPQSINCMIKNFGKNCVHSFNRCFESLSMIHCSEGDMIIGKKLIVRAMEGPYINAHIR